MKRHRRILMFGVLGPIAMWLSGCVGGSDTARDNARALEEAVAVAQSALEAAVPGIPGEVEALGVRNGVPVVQYHAPERSPAPLTGAYGYGAWLNGRGFAVYSAPALGITGDTYTLADPADASHGAPGAADGFSGTWSGVMLGVGAAPSADDTGVQGNAQMELHSGMGGATVDIEFSDVVGIRSGEAVDGHSWTGVSVTDSSFDGTSSDGGTIDGQFYGGHHEDVIGDFAYDDLMGAWGASRMTAGPGAAGDDMDGEGDMDGGDMDGGDMDGGDMDGGDMDGGDMDGDMDGGDMDGGDMDGGDMDMDGGDMDGMDDMDGGDMDGGDMDGGDMDGDDM